MLDELATKRYQVGTPRGTHLVDLVVLLENVGDAVEQPRDGSARKYPMGYPIQRGVGRGIMLDPELGRSLPLLDVLNLTRAFCGKRVFWINSVVGAIRRTSRLG